MRNSRVRIRSIHCPCFVSREMRPVQGAFINTLVGGSNKFSTSKKGGKKSSDPQNGGGGGEVQTTQIPIFFTLRTQITTTFSNTQKCMFNTFKIYYYVSIWGGKGGS